MANKVDWGTEGPRCPNHGVPLVTQGCDPGIGICPISDYEFSYDSDEREKKKKLVMTTLGAKEVTDWGVKQIRPEGRG